MSRRIDRVVSEKGPKDLVTDADLASQQAIRSILMEAFDQYLFVGEEEGENEPTDGGSSRRLRCAPLLGRRSARRNGQLRSPTAVIRGLDRSLRGGQDEVGSDL